MLTFDAGEILKAIGAIRTIEHAILNHKDTDNAKKRDPVPEAVAKGYLPYLNELLSGLNCRATTMAVVELKGHLRNKKAVLSFDVLGNLMQDIAITLRRELSLCKTFCVEPTRESFFELKFASFGPGFHTAFASAVFELDEAGKCHALSRSTACVFHLMRTLEIAIRATAKCLGIPDPVKGMDRNWGSMLGAIKDEIARRTKTQPLQWKGGDKEFFAAAYVSLDAVRVAWRNTTMHVENKYTDDEAEHIFVAVRGFMKMLAGRLDEQGQPLA